MVDLADLSAVLGRVCFALGPLDSARPFLAPIYSWYVAVGTKGRMAVPWPIAFLFDYLRGQFEEGS
eukprot:11219795-Lingulodinium_polyedra.AAC.1